MLARLILAGSLALAAAPALASSPMCPTDAHRERIHEFSRQLAAAGSTEEAQEMAFAKTRLDHEAVAKVRAVIDDPGLADAEAKLDAFEDEVRRARTPGEVAASFDQLGAESRACRYDKVEIALVIVGFLLGVIPGILFLLLFC